MKATLSRPAVRVVPFQPHCFAFGGFDLQMSASMESARAAGADVAPLDFWSREADFDILHLWGLELQHGSTVRWARAGGKKIVLSALVNYPNWRSSLRHWASLVVGPARLRRAMLAMIDWVTVVNQAQARYLTSALGFPADRVTVVPNIVDDIFFCFSSAVGHGPPGVRPSVLCTGNICRRKNQLALVRACLELGVSLVLVGKVLTGEEEYGRSVAEAMSGVDGYRWIQGLTAGSPELATAYRDAGVFALPSYDETQPISALEAAASGKSLVLADRPYAHQEFYANAALADPRSVRSIARALRTALDYPEAHRPPPRVLEQCRREKVGAAYVEIYRRLAQSVG